MCVLLYVMIASWHTLVFVTINKNWVILIFCSNVSLNFHSPQMCILFTTVKKSKIYFDYQQIFRPQGSVMCVNSFISVWNLTSDVTKTGKTGKYTRSLRMLFRDTAYYFTSFLTAHVIILDKLFKTYDLNFCPSHESTRYVQLRACKLKFRQAIQKPAERKQTSPKKKLMINFSNI